MKLEHLFEKENKQGTYAGVHFDKDTKDRLAKFIKTNKIPNGLNPDKFHTTLLYSRKYLPNYEPAGKVEMVGHPVEYDVWKTKPTESHPEPASCLVLKYSCDDLVDRHNDLMKEHGATHDFDEYIPHITLSYDIGDMDIDDLPDASTIGKINIVDEYGEDLNLNWANDNA